MTIPTPTQMR